MTSARELCPHCGEENAVGARFCARCGGPLPVRPAAPAPIPLPQRPTGTSRPPSTGSATGVRDDVYFAQRLSYPPSTTDFDPISNREYLRVTLVRAFVFWLVWTFGSSVLFLVFGLAGIAEVTSEASAAIDVYGDTTSSATGSAVVLYLWLVFSAVWTVGLWAFFWLTRIPVLLSEWMLTVDGAAAAAREVLDDVHATIRTRQPPVDELAVVQVAPNPQRPRLYLQLQAGRYLGFVSSFPVGADLFLGWTFWLSQSPLRWAWSVLVRAFRAVTLRSSALHDSLVFDDAKALREVIHSAVRDGVDVASATHVAGGSRAADGR